MTATLAAPETLTATANSATFVLAIDGMDRGVRGDVEKLLLLLPEGEPGEVWFTRWHRAPDGTYSCRERVVAPYADAVEFAAALEELAAQRGFVARLTQRPYAGIYD